VLDDLLAAGATEMRFVDQMPLEITDRSPRDDDEDLVALACRRTTFEWVLRRSVLAATGVTILDGTTAESLVTTATRTDGTDVPTVCGVRIVTGESKISTLRADIVIAAVGRRSAVPKMLSQIGVDPIGEAEDTGIIYLSRFFRLLPGAEPPPTSGPIGGDLGYLKYAVFQGDNRTFSVTFAVSTDDSELRVMLVDPTGFSRAAALLPATSAWVESERSIPITDVHVMGGLLNRKLDFIDENGSPLVLGFHAVGDAHTCTNPLYGRGCSLAMVQATLLANALANHPDDPVNRTVDYEKASERDIRPWYEAALAQDRLSRGSTADAESDGIVDDGDGDIESDQVDPGAFMRELLRDGMMPAVRTDASVFRAFVRTFNLLDPPDQLMNDPEVMAKVMQCFGERDTRRPEAPLGPPRKILVGALANEA